jgi:tRNA dimethylallyltransferase
METQPVGLLRGRALARSRSLLESSPPAGHRRGLDARTPRAVVGPTASGKTEAAVAIAESFGGEIVCVDSTTIYRGMDVGSAKPTPEQRLRIRHHLVDVADPHETFTVARYQALARTAIEDARARGRPILLVGGSGLYFRAVVDDLVFPPTDAATRAELEREATILGPDALYRRLAAVDPVAARRIEPDNVRRTIRALEVPTVTGRRFSEFARDWRRYPVEHVRAAGIEMPRDILANRIERRCKTAGSTARRRRARPSGTLSCRATRRGSAPSARRRRSSSSGRRHLPGARWRGFGVTRASAGSAPARTAPPASSTT